MTKIAYIATIQVLIDHPSIKSGIECSDFISEIMENMDGIRDWQYLKLNGQSLSPQEKTIPDPRYREGEAFE